MNKRTLITLPILAAGLTVLAADCAPETRESSVLRLAVIGDVQGYPYPEDAGMRNLERALDVLAPFKPDAVLTVGDINDSHPLRADRANCVQE